MLIVLIISCIHLTVHMKVQLEMLQMDLEDNETTMNSFDSQVEELRGTVASLEGQLAHSEAQKSEMEARLEDSQAQVETLSYFSICQTHCVS